MTSIVYYTCPSGLRFYTRDTYEMHNKENHLNNSDSCYNF